MAKLFGDGSFSTSLRRWPCSWLGSSSTGAPTEFSYIWLDQSLRLNDLRTNKRVHVMRVDLGDLPSKIFLCHPLHIRRRGNGNALPMCCCMYSMHNVMHAVASQHPTWKQPSCVLDRGSRTGIFWANTPFTLKHIHDASLPAREFPPIPRLVV